ncbi:hypothetical protein PR002_g28479, partial [Phytophthora rubi]
MVDIAATPTMPVRDHTCLLGTSFEACRGYAALTGPPGSRIYFGIGKIRH